MLDIRPLIPSALRKLVKQKAPDVIDFYFRLLKSPRQRVKDHVRSVTLDVVQSGPFAGMQLPTGQSWGSGWDIIPKLLGTYEQELHAPLELVKYRPYSAIVDIGSADGFYAVGLARLFPNSIVYAFDIDAGARNMTRIAAELNGVAERVRIREACDPQTLQELVKNETLVLIISDCEGYELTLFGDVENATALCNCDILIESHDVYFPGCTGKLSDVLTQTHHVEIIPSGARNPNSFEFLAQLSEDDRWSAVSESRPCKMHWLWCGVKRQVDNSPEKIISVP